METIRESSDHLHKMDYLEHQMCGAVNSACNDAVLAFRNCVVTTVDIVSGSKTGEGGTHFGRNRTASPRDHEP